MKVLEDAIDERGFRIGSQLVQHMTTSRAVYGAFAAVLGLLAWIHLQVQVLVIALEIGRLSGEREPAVSPAAAPRRRDRVAARSVAGSTAEGWMVTPYPTSSGCNA